MTICERHCEGGGWLPLMPPANHPDNCRDAAEIDGVTVAMLWPAAYIACPCHSSPADHRLTIDPLDIWRLAPDESVQLPCGQQDT